jgi:hypothetical protein
MCAQQHRDKETQRQRDKERDTKTDTQTDTQRARRYMLDGVATTDGEGEAGGDGSFASAMGSYCCAVDGSFASAMYSSGGGGGGGGGGAALL